MFVLRYLVVSVFVEAVQRRLAEFYFLAVCFPARETKCGDPLTAGPQSKLRKFHKHGLISPKSPHSSRR